MIPIWTRNVIKCHKKFEKKTLTIHNIFINNNNIYIASIDNVQEAEEVVAEGNIDYKNSATVIKKATKEYYTLLQCSYKTNNFCFLVLTKIAVLYLLLYFIFL